MVRVIRKFKLPRRRTLIAWVALGFVVPLIYPTWLLVRPPQGIRICPEVTYRTEPIHENGYVDFTDEWNERLRSLAGTEERQAFDEIELAAVGYDLAETSSTKRQAVERLIDVIRTRQGAIQMPSIEDGSLWMKSKLPTLRAHPISYSSMRPLAEDLESWTLRAIRDDDNVATIKWLRALMDMQRYLDRRSAYSSLEINDYRHIAIKRILTAAIRHTLTLEQTSLLVSELPDLTLQDLIEILRIARMRQLTYVFAQHAREIPTTDLTPAANRDWLTRTVLAFTERREYGGVNWNVALAALNRLYDQTEDQLRQYCRGRVSADCIVSDIAEADSERMIIWSYRTSDDAFTELFRRDVVCSADGLVTHLIREWLHLQRQLAFARTAVSLMHCAVSDTFPDDLHGLNLSSHSNVFKRDLRYEAKSSRVRLGLFGRGGGDWLCEWNRHGATREWVLSAKHGNIPDWTLQP